MAKEMERVTLTGGMEMSRIIYGMWRLGDDSDTSPAHVQAKVEACLVQGITTMDQADIYGDYGAEALFGAALAQAPALRDQIEIVTKCDIIAPIGKFSDKPVKYYDTSRAHIEAQVDASLTNMGIEQIDLLLVHRPDPFMDHHETGAVLDDLVSAGKVAHIGVSNFRPWDWDLLQSAMKNTLVTNQIEISLLANACFTNGDLSHLQKLGVAPMAWSPLAGGALFSGAPPRLTEMLHMLADQQGVGMDAIAVAWLLAHPATIMPVMGTNTLGRIAGLSDALRVEMDRTTWFALYEAANGVEVP